MESTTPPKKPTTTNAGKRFPGQKRQRRFIPNPDAFPGFRLQGRDLELIRIIHRYRFVTADHVRALAPGSVDGAPAPSAQGITRRLGALFHTKHLARLVPTMRVRLLAASELRPPIVYALATRGKQALEAAGEDEIAWTPDWNLRKQPHLEHELMVSNFRIALELALAQPVPADLEFIDWGSEEGLRDTVTVEGGKYHPGKKVTYQVTPDGHAAVRAAGKRTNLFLEADHGSEESARIAYKARAYWWYLTKECRNYWERYESPEQRRVLFVTTTQRRMENMMQTVASIEEFEGRGLKLFWFTTEDAFSVKEPASILRPIWRVLSNVQGAGRNVSYDVEHKALFS